MNIKEQVINESIARINERLIKIKNILDANPIGEICKIRLEAQKLLEENKTIEQRTSKEFVVKIEMLAKREKEQFRLVKQMKNTSKLIDEQVDLEMQLQELNTELYYIERKRTK